MILMQHAHMKSSQELGLIQEDYIGGGLVARSLHSVRTTGAEHSPEHAMEHSVIKPAECPHSSLTRYQTRYD